jgi:hypothetical protein
MTDFEPIPDFLRRTPGDAAPVRYVQRIRHETWARPTPPRGWPKGMPAPKTVTPEAIALAREIDKAEKEKAAARFAALRARRS